MSTAGSTDLDALAATQLDGDESRGGRDAREPAADESIGRFRVTGVLGRGAMGLVVSAHDPDLDRRVAIKLVRPTGTEEEASNLRARLLREARAMARLRHPSVVSVYEAGEYEGQVYVAMEHVEGGTLRRAIAAMGPTPDWRAVVALFVDAAHGLAAAHAAGLVHRDFKPDNVLVDHAGRALVGDFGLVLAAEPDLAGSSAHSVAPGLALTRANAIVGSPAYMAPEQWRGGEVDARSDQFAFCVALYEALYGELPFEGDRPIEYAAAVLTGALRTPKENRAVPEWLSHVVRRGLAGAPEGRFRSMTELLAELGADRGLTRRPGRRERSLTMIGLGAFAATLVTSIVAFGIEPSYAFFYASHGTFLALTSALGALAWPALSVSTFNRHTYGLILVIAVVPLILAVGGQLQGASAREIQTQTLAIYGTAFFASAIVLERLLSLAAAAYLFGFLVASVLPDAVFAVVFATHAIALAGILIAFNRREGAQI